MPRSALVLVLATSMVGCHSGGAKIVGAMALGFTGGGIATVAQNDEDTRALGITAIVVGTYMILTAVGLEARAQERSWTSSAGGTGETSASASVGDDGSSAVGSAQPSGETEVQRRTSHPGYDRTGAYAGRVDQSGSYYDRTGAYDGRVDPGGSYYDRTGAAAGRVDGSGGVYDRTGASAGRVDGRGAMYDKTGAAAGRIDADGNIYDRTGAYAGRVDGACDEACRRETAGRILTAP